MLDPTTSVTSIARPQAPVRTNVVFKMLTSDRMAGSVPAWIKASDPKDQSVADLAATSRKAKFADDLARAQNETGPDQNVMAYGPQQTSSAANSEKADEPFGFGDLVDIVNPLQHIPLVSNLYRAVTGDKIRPSSDIIGGALYGGLAGAAGGLANVIIKHETGKNVMEHAVAMVAGNDTPTASAVDPAKNTAPPATGISAGNTEKPLERLAEAENNALQSLPGSALSFVDLASHNVKPLGAKPERYAAMYRFNA
ncbi:MAG: hypothetical protein JWO78_810 [Micavibrio sp.]|nr:hypothetical protein [Micavibrio sp.]